MTHDPHPLVIPLARHPTMPSLNNDLIRMIIKGDVAAVAGLLEQGADVNTTGGVTPVGASNTASFFSIPLKLP